VTLLERMDRVVFATRLDRLVFMKMQPRTLRWTPLVLLMILMAGFVLMARAPLGNVRDYLAGALLFYGAFVVASLVRIFGPRLASSGSQRLDERELMVKARAYAISGAALAILTMVFCFYMSSAGVLGLWQPRFTDWINLGFGIQAGGMILPTLIASWLQPRPVVDHDERPVVDHDD
jgi:hypothetical protein